MKIDADEKDLLESVGRGEWKSAVASASERAIPAMPRPRSVKDRRLNIRLSSKDLEAIRSERSEGSGAAARLGIARSTLESKIRGLGIDKSGFRHLRARK